MLVDNKVLHLYDPKLPIVVICDSSQVGVGAVLCHVVNGVEKPVFYASSTLSKAERNYPNLHREALAVVFGLTKFAKYIFGRKILVVTDNKPLVAIFDQKKGIPPLAAARLQKYAYAIAIFEFEIVYRKGTKIPEADALSRLPIEGVTGIDSDVTICSVEEEVSLDFTLIGRETQRDPILKRLFNYVKNGWDDHAVEKDLKFFYEKLSSLSIAEECLLFCERVLIPSSCQQRVLELLHGCHLGIVRMKQMARRYVYWRGLDDDIENFVRTCKVCSVTGRSVSKKFSTWPSVTRPFERLHVDFFHICGKTLLIVVDSFSKWIEVRIMRTTDAQAVIDELESIFVVFGYCDEIVSDNGPPFGSGMMKKWADFFKIKLTKSPSYCPEANGLAERGVQTAKTSLCKMLNDPKYMHKSLKEMINVFLMSYRNSYSQALGCNPSDKMFNFNPKIDLDVKFKSPKEEKKKGKKKVRFDDRIRYSDGHTQKKGNEFKIEDLVWYKNEFKTERNWVEAKIVGINSPSTYYIDINGVVKLASRNQLKVRHLKKDYYIFPKVPVESEMRKKRLRSDDSPILKEQQHTKRRKSKRKKKKPDFWHNAYNRQHRGNYC